MPDELKVDTVQSSTTDVRGRSLNAARTNHFVIDWSAGPNEALTSAESFLAGVSSCGVLLVQSYARQWDIPLDKADATIEGIRDAADLTKFLSVSIRFELTGPSQEDGARLVQTYKDR